MADLAAMTFEIIKDRLPNGYTLADWKEGTKDFEFIPVESRGKTVGAIMAKGPTKSILKFIKDRAERFGCVQTYVANDHNPGHRFAERLGFKAIDQNEVVTMYRKEYAK